MTRRALVVVGAVAAVVAVVGLFIDVREVAAAFLVAYAATLSVTLAMLALTMIARLTTATWFAAFRRSADAVAGALPVLAILGVPLIVAMPVLHQPAAPGSARETYGAMPFLIARFIVYWIVWLTIAARLRSAQRMEDAGNATDAARRFRIISCAGLIALALTMTFASFDWMMSLTPEWYSTVYGVYWFGGGMVGALALLAVLARRPSAHVTADELQALGKLLLTFVMFWVYAGFAQYIVIWSGDIPREVAWYVPRNRGGWGGVALVLLLGSVAIPFVLLLVLRVKRSGVLLGALGALLIVFHYVDTYWVVMPGLVPLRWWTVVVSAATLAFVALAAVGSAALTARVERRVRS